MIKVRNLASLSVEEFAQLKRRSESNIEEALSTAGNIIERIRSVGDEALVDLTRKFDYAGAESSNLKVQDSEFEVAKKTLSPQVAAAIEAAFTNISKFHQKQMPEELWFVEVQEGVMAGEKTTPITSVGLYVPRGKGSFPSVMLMLGIPASIAGVENVIVCTPTGPDGIVDPATLFAAELCGLTQIYKVGGAQAIAALALGTTQIPKVAKIMGPGNTFASAAKRLLFGQVDVGLPAGPSEGIILADEHADPKLAAHDLLVEAEHGPDSASLLVTHSHKLMEDVLKLLPDLLEALPEPRRKFCKAVFASHGGIVVTDSLNASIEFINDYAPEHLEILTADPFSLLGRIKNVGEILMGSHTPIALGNYCIGTNAILPTGGFAKTYSGVSVFDFIKRSGIGYVTDSGYAKLNAVAATLAEYEGFPAHAQSIIVRNLGFDIDSEVKA